MYGWASRDGTWRVRVVETDDGPALEVKRNDEWLAWVTSVRALGELVPLDQLVQLPAES